MKKFKNFILEVLYRFSKFISLLIILAISSLIIYSSLTSMFSKNYTENVSYNKSIGVEQENAKSNIIEINIPSDATALDVSKILISGNLINKEEDFLKFLEDEGISKFKQGNFKLKRNMTFQEIADAIKA